LKPNLGPNALTLNIVRPSSGSISSEVYAIYHGRFIEMLLAHFDGLFGNANASALAAEGDII
jgi:hypothetical protein